MNSLLQERFAPSLLAVAGSRDASPPISYADMEWNSALELSDLTYSKQRALFSIKQLLGEGGVAYRVVNWPLRNALFARLIACISSSVVQHAAHQYGGKPHAGNS